MQELVKNYPPTADEVEEFLKQKNFTLPIGFIDFFKETNGATISTDEKYIDLWALTDMIQLNIDYGIDNYALGFFIIGSDGGDTAYAIEKNTGYIYQLPFVGMSREEAVFESKTFTEFIKSI